MFTIHLRTRCADGCVQDQSHVYLTKEEASQAKYRILTWLRRTRRSACLVLASATSWTKIRFQAGRLLSFVKGVFATICNAARRGINWLLGLFQAQSVITSQGVTPEVVSPEETYLQQMNENAARGLRETATLLRKTEAEGARLGAEAKAIVQEFAEALASRQSA